MKIIIPRRNEKIGKAQFKENRNQVTNSLTNVYTESIHLHPSINASYADEAIPICMGDFEIVLFQRLEPQYNAHLDFCESEMLCI